MKLIELAHCKNSLDFQPIRSWPHHLPILIYQSEKLCGFHHDTGMGLEIESNVCETFAQAHPKLTLPEVARLKKCLDTRPFFTMNELLRYYQLRWSDDLEMLCDRIVELSFEVQSWISERDFGARELAVLRLVDPALLKQEPLAEFFTHLSQSQGSRSESARILEMGVELFLKGHQTRGWFPQKKELASKWLKRLEEMRYPQTTRRDVEKTAAIAHLAWPAKTQARWVRKGDVAQLELKIMATSTEEFERKVNGLIALKPDLENLWK